MPSRNSPPVLFKIILCLALVAAIAVGLPMAIRAFQSHQEQELAQANAQSSASAAPKRPSAKTPKTKPVGTKPGADRP